MDSILNSFPQTLAYQQALAALAALALLCIMVLMRGFLAGALGLARSDEVPGQPLKGSHKDSSFRIIRTYGNSIENFSILIASALLAVLAGVPANWVNWLVGLHILVRMLYWVVYYGGFGKVAAGPRTIIYTMGWLLNAVLAIITAYVIIL